MRKTIIYVAVWLAAGLGAVALGSAAVSLVGNQVTGSRPAPLSADEVRSELSGDLSTSTTVVADGPTTSTSPPGGTTDTTGPPQPTTTAAPSRPGGTLPTTSTPQPAPPPETRTYSLVGGTATLRFEANGVTVQEATPKPGFAVELEPAHGNGWQVEFSNDAHKSRVEGWWDGGPRDEVREEEG